MRIRDFDAATYLDSPQVIAAYLEDALEDDDPAEFLEALGVVARAKGMTELARQVGVSRPALYRSLTASAHPDFLTILRILKGIGVELRVVASTSPIEAA